MIHFQRGKKRTIYSEINVTPFVDVMLVLVVVFMITAPMLVTGIEIDLPAGSGVANINEQKEPLTVSIDKNGKIYILDLEIEEKTLSDHLNNITKQDYKTDIIVKGDKNLAYGQIIKILSTINATGFQKVVLITSEDNQK